MKRNHCNWESKQVVDSLLPFTTYQQWYLASTSVQDHALQRQWIIISLTCKVCLAKPDGASVKDVMAKTLHHSLCVWLHFTKTSALTLKVSVLLWAVLRFSQGGIRFALLLELGWHHPGSRLDHAPLHRLSLQLTALRSTEPKSPQSQGLVSNLLPLIAPDSLPVPKIGKAAASFAGRGKHFRSPAFT